MKSRDLLRCSKLKVSLYEAVGLEVCCLIVSVCGLETRAMWRAYMTD